MNNTGSTEIWIAAIDVTVQYNEGKDGGATVTPIFSINSSGSHLPDNITVKVSANNQSNIDIKYPAGEGENAVLMLNFTQTGCTGSVECYVIGITFNTVYVPGSNLIKKYPFGVSSALAGTNLTLGSSDLPGGPYSIAIPQYTIGVLHRLLDTTAKTSVQDTFKVVFADKNNTIYVSDPTITNNPS